MLLIVDPDVIGPDDLRQPVPGQAPFDLWGARRAWIDTRLQAFMSLTRMVNGQAVYSVDVIAVSAGPAITDGATE